MKQPSLSVETTEGSGCFPPLETALATDEVDAMKGQGHAHTGARDKPGGTQMAKVVEALLMLLPRHRRYSCCDATSIMN